MEKFKINDDIEIVCEAEKTRSGFRHVATLLKNGREADSVKICYLNRTWEKYEFDSVIEKLAESKILSEEEKQLVKDFIENRTSDRGTADLKLVATIAKLGDLFGTTPTEKNDFKTRILKAGLENKGLIIPDDWDSLDEETKEARLNGAIGALA